MSENSGVLLDKKKYPDDLQSLLELEVVGHTRSKPGKIKGIGESLTYKIFFSDGSTMPVKRTVPKNQVSWVSTDFTFPLGTNMRGFNGLVANSFAKKGIHSRSVGTNESNGRSLSRDTWLSLLALNYDDTRQKETQSQTCDAGRSVSLGYSMALLKALIMEAHAPELGRKIEVTLGMDPGPIEKVPLNPKEAVLFALWNTQQIFELPKIGYQNFKDESPKKAITTIVQLALTLSLSPMQVWNTVDKLRTIAKGEINGLLDEIPAEAVMIIHFFKGRYNQKERLAEKLGGRANVRLLYENGVHISGASPRVLKSFIAQVALATELVDRGVDKNELAEALNTSLLPPG